MSDAGDAYDAGAPAPPRLRSLYVIRPGDSDDAPHLVTDVTEVDWTSDVLVSTTPAATPGVGSGGRSRFVSVGDAIENAPDVRDALLSLSPDPKLERFRKLRAVALAAPVAWMMFVASDGKQVAELASDAGKLVSSPAFKAAEQDPDTSAMTLARHAKIDRAVAMRVAYVGVEAIVGFAAIAVLIAGLRRFRALPIAVGTGAGLWWLFHAGQPQWCFGVGAVRELILALLGLAGAVAAFVLAPSESRVVEDLRGRLGLPGANDKRFTLEDQDLLALLPAVWAGLLLPFFLRWLGTAGIRDLGRATFFVGFCLVCFLGFLAWRKELSRVVPRWPALALAAALGFGITAACDVASRAALATVIEAKTCINPESATNLKKLQESSAKETTAARKETQTQVLAFWIAVLAAPLAEEMLYRGTIQRLARRRLGERWAMLVSGATFGFAHALAFPAAFYQHFGLGLAFAAVFELAGAGAVGVLASAATHAMWNGWLAAMPVF